MIAVKSQFGPHGWDLRSRFEHTPVHGHASYQANAPTKAFHADIVQTSDHRSVERGDSDGTKSADRENGDEATEVIPEKLHSDVNFRDSLLQDDDGEFLRCVDDSTGYSPSLLAPDTTTDRADYTLSGRGEAESKRSLLSDVWWESARDTAERLHAAHVSAIQTRLSSHSEQVASGTVHTSLDTPCDSATHHAPEMSRHLLGDSHSETSAHPHPDKVDFNDGIVSVRVCLCEKRWTDQLLLCDDGEYISRTIGGCQGGDESFSPAGVLRFQDERRKPAVIENGGLACNAEMKEQLLSDASRVYLVKTSIQLGCDPTCVASCSLLIYKMAHSPALGLPRNCPAEFLVDVALYICQKFHANHDEPLCQLDAYYIRHKYFGYDKPCITASLHTKGCERIQHSDGCVAFRKIELMVMNCVDFFVPTPPVVDYIELMWSNWCRQYPLGVNAKSQSILLTELKRGVCFMYLCPSFVRTDLVSSADLALSYLQYAIPCLVHYLRFDDPYQVANAQLPIQFQASYVTVRAVYFFEQILQIPSTSGCRLKGRGAQEFTAMSTTGAPPPKTAPPYLSITDLLTPAIQRPKRKASDAEAGRIVSKERRRDCE
jgi:hypothetical protein